MGTIGSPAWKTKRDVVNAILSECYGPSRVVVEKKSTGSGLWLLVRDTDGNLAIDFFKIERLTYKSMTESMHPYFYDCPLSFLEAAPEACADWREKVRTFHARKAQTFKRGDRVTIYGKRYTVEEPHGRGWLVRLIESGKVFKAQSKNMRLTEEVEREAAENRARIMAAPYRTISAFGDWHEAVPAGWVGLIATRDGNRQGIGDEIRVLVPADVYAARTGIGLTLTGNERPWPHKGA